jgi:hypothetical protein
VFQKLVSHNDDIRRLVEKGYAVAFDSNHLIVQDVPYLDSELRLQVGAIVAALVFIDQERVTQTDHQVLFSGSHPYGLDGKPLSNLGGGPVQLALSDASKDIVVQRSFSNKPKATGRFEDFFEKIESYVSIISGPAIERHQVTPYTFRAVKEIAQDSVFKFHDTLTSRAGLFDLASNFKEDVLAVIGLGGTGAYLLDFLVKTPAREVRGFDVDRFYVHNAFRSPGRLEPNELGRPKAEVYQTRYENFRAGLSAKAKIIDADCAEDLDGVTFAFVCVDQGSSRATIFDLLISKGIPFIDVGMGLKRQDGRLNGMLRTTLYSVTDAKATREKGLAPLVDAPDDLYKANIQIAELNALNACLAIVLFKQMRGFYFQESPVYNLVFEIADIKVVGES